MAEQDFITKFAEVKEKGLTFPDFLELVGLWEELQPYLEQYYMRTGGVVDIENQEKKPSKISEPFIKQPPDLHVSSVETVKKFLELPNNWRYGAVKFDADYINKIIEMIYRNHWEDVQVYPVSNGTVQFVRGDSLNYVVFTVEKDFSCTLYVQPQDGHGSENVATPEKFNYILDRYFPGVRKV